eukprot:6210658-Pleurochrysis_carterae.AAC.2
MYQLTARGTGQAIFKGRPGPSQHELKPELVAHQRLNEGPRKNNVVVLHAKKRAEVTVTARNTGQAIFKCPSPSQDELQPVKVQSSPSTRYGMTDAFDALRT